MGSCQNKIGERGELIVRTKNNIKRNEKSSAPGIPTWSPTVVLTRRYDAYLPQSGRDAKLSSFYGRTRLVHENWGIYLSE